MQYRIEACGSKYDLINKIGELIKEGWRPQGGVSFSYHGGYRETWVQAMVKGNKDV